MKNFSIALFQQFYLASALLLTFSLSVSSMMQPDFVPRPPPKYRCPITTHCDWSGAARNLSEHLQKIHGVGNFPAAFGDYIEIQTKKSHRKVIHSILYPKQGLLLRVESTLNCLNIVVISIWPNGVDSPIFITLSSLSRLKKKLVSMTCSELPTGEVITYNPCYVLEVKLSHKVHDIFIMLSDQMPPTVPVSGKVSPSHLLWENAPANDEIGTATKRKSAPAVLTEHIASMNILTAFGPPIDH